MLPTSLAGDLYRCGNSYQDQPCTSTVSINVTTNKAQHTKQTQAVKELQNDSTVNAGCKQRGEAAKAITKLR